MKKYSFIALGLMTLSAAIFWSQQDRTESAKQDIYNIGISNKAVELQKLASAFTKIVESESRIITDNENDLAQPQMTREEIIKTSRLKALKDSGLEKKIAERKYQVETRLEQLRLARESSPGHNESVNKQLNIDVKETFGVDFDTRMAAVHAQRQQKDSAELEKRLRAWGVGPEQIEEITAMRNLVLDVSNNSSLSKR